MDTETPEHCFPWTQKLQQEMDRVSNDRCLQCGNEGSEYHMLYECEAHTKIRLDMPRDISKHHQQAVTDTRKMIWESGFVVKPMEHRTGYRWEDT